MAYSYQSVKIKPQTIRSEVYLTGDIDYSGVSRSSTIQQLFDTNNPYYLKYLSEQELEDSNIEDVRKIELSYLITNSIKMWLMSKVGDYGRLHPGIGGPLDEYIGKVISEDKAKDIENSLRTKIEQTFSSVVTTDTITVKPVPEKNMYQIYFVFTYILVKKVFSVQMELNA